ncbi:MAG TPA: Mur ligase domain-containing protein, partial [Candidatus Saccharimonadales bacterium]|nr:Mur ligase domain-containing protein [Candidatus Saccharimonadales bacterium]
MHIYFSGIGGTGIGPLALVAKQAGYTVSGSDKQDSQYIEYLKKHGITDIHIGQTYEAIATEHAKNPIDWFVYTSALPMENPDAPELLFCREQDIHTSKRDELLNKIITDKHLKLIAVAGTHGKSTTTAMVIWLFKQLGVPIGYNVGAKMSFGDMGEFAPGAEYFVYECDEFDRNFLAFEPYLSLISGVSWDHHDIYPTREEYQAAFRDFINQSRHTILWHEDAEYLVLDEEDGALAVELSDNPTINGIALKGRYTRLDAWLAVQAVHRVTGAPVEDLLHHVDRFPGLQRRMEPLVPNLYSDYAHTVDKIRGAMSVAREMADESGQDLVVVYEGLHNKRQYYIMNDYKDCFDGAAQVYWVPSYLAREDPDQRILPPQELIMRLSDPSIAVPAELDGDLKRTIQAH